MRCRTFTVSAVFVVLFSGVFASALVMTDQQGRWPADWPKSLEGLRGHARTIQIATGTQENVYEITFSNRAEFESAWPSILSLKTIGAPLRLYAVGKPPPAGLGQFASNAAPIVRIYGPPQSESVATDGQKLKASAPWPKEIYGPNGELPEFVRTRSVGGELQWVAANPDESKEPCFYDRARVDIDVVIDGVVIDLNRISLPAGTPIEDHRF